MVGYLPLRHVGFPTLYSESRISSNEIVLNQSNKFILIALSFLTLNEYVTTIIKIAYTKENELE